MTLQIRIAGFGGQGVMVLGQMIAFSATSIGMNAMFVPTYGPETRGGTANCMVTISNDRIYSPVFIKADYLIAFNEPSFNKFSDKIKDTGKIIYNSSLVSLQENKPHLFGLPATELANKLGSPRSVNMILLGELLRQTQIFKEEVVLNALEHYLGNKKDILELNRKALHLK